jgi:hypothetical protein
MVFQRNGLARENTVMDRRPPPIPRQSPHGRVALRHQDASSHERPIGVVIDLDALGSPNQVHRELRCHHEVNGALEALGPTGNRPERRPLPVECTNARPTRRRSRAKLMVRGERPCPLSLSRAPGERASHSLKDDRLAQAIRIKKQVHADGLAWSCAH